MYGASSYGMTLHFHYCCGKLDKVDFTPAKEKFCGSSSINKIGAEPCCDNKQVEIKIKSEQDPAKVFHSSFHCEAATPFYHNYFVLSPLENKNLLPEVFAPPSLFSEPLFILNCVFRI